VFVSFTRKGTQISLLSSKYDTKTKGIDFPIAMSTSILRAMKLYEYEWEQIPTLIVMYSVLAESNPRSCQKGLFIFDYILR